MQKSRDSVIFLMSTRSLYFPLPLLIGFIEVLNQPIAQVVVSQHRPLQFPAEEIDIDIHVGLQRQAHCLFVLFIPLKMRNCGVLRASEENSLINLIEASRHLCFVALSMGSLVEAFWDLAVADETLPSWRRIANVLVKTGIEAFFDLLLSHHFLLQLEEKLDVNRGAFVLQGAMKRFIDHITGSVTIT